MRYRGQSMKTLLLALLCFTMPMTAFGVTVQSGTMAPNFKLKGHDGKEHNLKDFKGKWVVLEWYNEGCPYVEKHYTPPKRNMQTLQKTYTKKDVVWLSIISSAPGKQGYVEPKNGATLLSKHQSKPSLILFDPDGRVGKMYDAKTTPHMYVINPKGTLVYQGAIDDKPSARLASLEGATPIFANALNSAMAGKAISNPTTKPYGCSVKYQ